MTESTSNPPFATGLLFEFIALTNVLDRDVVASRSALLEDDSQFTRRQFLHAVTAKIEATVGGMIRIALGVYRGGGEPFTPAEYALLQERVLESREGGSLYETQAQLTTKANIKFAFAMFTRAVQSDYSLPADDHEWAALTHAFAIRDRITLPRSAQDLDLTEDELRTVHDADVWFDHCCAAALKGTHYESQPERTA
jgi:hypothetical protein